VQVPPWPAQVDLTAYGGKTGVTCRRQELRRRLPSAGGESRRYGDAGQPAAEELAAGFVELLKTGLLAAANSARAGALDPKRLAELVFACAL
jgi:hypothetical protein